MGLQFELQAKNHGVMFNSARQQQRTSQRWCARVGKTLHQPLRCSPRCSRSDRHHQKANAASMGILDKQESLRIQCVHNDAGGFPERSTQPMVGSNHVRRTAAVGSTARQEHPALPENPVRPKNALHSHEKRYSLTSSRPDPSFRAESQSLRSVYRYQLSSPSHNHQKAFATAAFPQSHRTIRKLDDLDLTHTSHGT